MNWNRRLLPLAIGWTLALLARTSLADPPSTPVDDVQDILLLTRPGPILVRLHIRVGDQPLHAAWRDVCGEDPSVYGYK